VERPYAPLSHQGRARRSRDRWRVTVRSGPRHHHLPGSLARISLAPSSSHRPHPRRGAHGPRRGTGRRFGPRPAAHSRVRPTTNAIALEAIVCDTAPVAFTSLSLDPRLLEGVRDLGFVETRPIQSAVIPLALGGHDVIACAETGTGKTCAFVVPIVQQL